MVRLGWINFRLFFEKTEIFYILSQFLSSTERNLLVFLKKAVDRSVLRPLPRLGEPISTSLVNNYIPPLPVL